MAAVVLSVRGASKAFGALVVADDIGLDTQARLVAARCPQLRSRHPVWRAY